MPTQKFFNRDLSWLEFNRRVLFQAQNKNHPLLERVKFLAIFAGNLDEFFMKRVGYLRRLVKSGSSVCGVDGIQPQIIFKQVRQMVLQLQEELATTYKYIIHELKAHGVELTVWQNLSEQEKDFIKDYFRKKIFPVLTPLAVDPSHPFPFLSNLSVSLGITLHSETQDRHLFARIKIPNMLPQWIQIPHSSSIDLLKFIRLSDIIENNLGELFPEISITQVVPFRVTRNADIDIHDEDSEDILEIVEEELRQRRLAQVVRMEYLRTHKSTTIDLLQEELGIDEDDIYQIEGELDYTTLYEIAGLHIPRLKYPVSTPAIPARLFDENESIFKTIQEGDLLVHHPYESFSASVEKFIRDAVHDPKVLAIKMTVYRTGSESPFIPLLIEAAEQGKQTVCVVEVKARFDEERNLYWVEKLEKAGVHVVYGVVGFKTHTKIALVVRKENDDFNFYAHIGTGNYNNQTAKSYTDLGLFTARRSVTTELIEIFNYLTGLSLKRNYQTFLLSPINMRERFTQLILNEINNHKQKKPAHIIAKMNSLEDKQICELLYQASQAGVKIDLFVRGFCCLRPKVLRLSKNIRVISIVGRYLEHSRLFYFRNGATQPEKALFFIGSADWMSRNLNNRVETIVPIEDEKIKLECWHILQAYLEETSLAWELQKDGKYIPLATQQEISNLHENFMLFTKQQNTL